MPKQKKSVFAQFDPEDISSQKGLKKREQSRRDLIRQFIKWSWKGKWTDEYEERVVLKRHQAYYRMLYVFGAITNFALYNAFLTGIYNLGNRELLDTRRVPTLVKLGLSTGFSIGMCYHLWHKNIYD